MAEAETRAAREHNKTGTFGYQVLNGSGTHVGYVVDEAGNRLPGKAVYSHEVVDQNPLLPFSGSTQHLAETFFGRLDYVHWNLLAKECPL